MERIPSLLLWRRLNVHMSKFPADRFDVVIVGAGPAGVSAAIVLGKAGFSVLLCEAARFPGAENWSGAVYFAESLERPEAFGKSIVEAAPYERRLVERGAYLYNGHTLVGASLRSPEVFRSCYTVLRPVYDRYLAEITREHGVVLACETTVEGLIRHQGRVVGVHTERGPVYADVVFLAEGDAAHLVTQEGYERPPESQEKAAPHFLQGVKEVISLAPEVLEERFGVAPGEGKALELVLRNGTRGGRTVPLNMGAFIYTNRDSISLGYVLPLDNLKRSFEGDHNLLMEWFKALPEVARLIEGGELTSYGAKLIRGGGFREIPRLIDDGLAIGGAASGIGLDFPYPNFTGPATAMGLYFAAAVKQIAAANGGPRQQRDPVASPFTEAALRRSYLASLHGSHHYRNVRYLEGWPEYIERTSFFFDRQVDLLNNSVYLLSRTDRGAARRWWQWVESIRRVVPLRHAGAALADVRDLAGTIGVGGLLRASVRPATVARFLWNSVAALVPLGGNAAVGSRDPDPSLAGAGIAEATAPDGAHLRAVFRVQAGAESAGRPPILFRWYWKRFGDALAGAFSAVYTNDDMALEDKLRSAARQLAGRMAIWDVFKASGLGVAVLATATVQVAVDWFRSRVLRWRFGRFLKQPVARLLIENRERLRQDADAVRIVTAYDAKLATITYQEATNSHIKVMWPDDIAQHAELADSPLWNVCPAKVYEVRSSPGSQPGIVVNVENCIKCESCWRATDDVHWTRATAHRLIYQVYTPAQGELRDYLLQRPVPRARLATGRGFWASFLPSGEGVAIDIDCAVALARLRTQLDRVRGGLQVYMDELHRSPVALDEGRREHLAALIGSAIAAFEVGSEQWQEESLGAPRVAGGESITALWSDTQQRLEQICDQARAGRFFWAESLASQVIAHHVVGLDRYCERLARGAEVSSELADDKAVVSWNRSLAWRAIEARPALFASEREQVHQQAREMFDGPALRRLEGGSPLASPQREWLRTQVATVAAPRGDGNFCRRDLLIEELAALDPALAYLVVSHLLVGDLLSATALADGELIDGEQPWSAAVVWGQRHVGMRDDGVMTLSGTVDFVPTALAQRLLVVHEGKGYLVDCDAPGLRFDDVGTVGLLGAGVRRLEMVDVEPLKTVDLTPYADPVGLEAPAAGDACARVLGRALPDLLALARGAGAYLLTRAREHASSRVQFPGAFADEAGHDTIAKFGAVKQMLAEMEAQRYLLEAVSLLNPAGDAHPWVGIAAAKVILSEALGPGPGSFAYNAGQVFGGTAFSEDDNIAKYYRDSAPMRFLFGHDDALRIEIGRCQLQAVWAGETLIPGTEADNEYLRLASEHLLLHELEQRYRDGCATVERWAAKLCDDPGDATLRWVGDAVVRALAVKASLLRATWRLDAGIPSESIIEAARLLADRWAADAQGVVDEAELVAATIEAGDSLLRSGELFPAPKIPDAESYADIIGADRSYESGQWLQAFDPEHGRYLPEILCNDDALAACWQSLEAEFRERYEDREFDGLSYGRYVEKLHSIPATDVDYLIKRGFLRMPIAKAYGGEGTLKAEYYILCKLIGRYGDAALALTIMGSTSIGTTPVMIGLNDDLPRARGELDRLAARPEMLGEIGAGIDRMLRMLRRPDAVAVTAAYGEVMALVRTRLVKSTVLKGIGAEFLSAFFAAGAAGKRRDLAAFGGHLRRSRALLDAIPAGVERAAHETPRRERAHELFLRMISAGYVSAFALTEPTAGSDSGGVKTVARPDSRPVYRDDDGVLFFWLDEPGQRDRRNLVDADRLEFDFDDRRILYRYSDDADPAPVEHGEYNYETDAPEGQRFYLHGTRKVLFSDIGQVHEVDGAPTYSYWVLNGSKMWITNGRICHCMALYARLEPEGVTGFMVDRHAEGLVVGADEAKLGQRGAPTNELSFTNVRVPREAIIGLRGRGQVNALETLNTGRAGLAVTTHATIQEMGDDVRPYLNGERTPMFGYQPRPAARPIERYWAGRVAAELVGTAATTFELVGLLDNKHTASVRIESAIGKYYGSEAVHEVVDWMERVRGLEGQTWLHRVEKTRRDARVLNIYEGTNEVQRFLILKDLVQRVLPQWHVSEPDAELTAGLEHADLAAALHQAKAMLRGHLENAVQRFGQQVWANVGLQPTFFRLSEIAGLTKVVDAVLYRLEWCFRHAVGDAYLQRVNRSGRLCVERSLGRIRALDRRYRMSLEYLTEGRYAPETQLGFLSLEESGAVAEGWGQVPERFIVAPSLEPLKSTVDVAVLLKPVPVVAPRARLAAGEFAEPLYALNASDAVALRMAIALKSRDRGRIRVTAYALGGRPSVAVLREALAAGVDDAVYLEVKSDNNGGGAAHDGRYVAEAIVKMLERRPAELVLCGDTAADTGQGLVPAYLGARLGCGLLSGVERVRWTGERVRSVRATAASWQGLEITQALPCVVAASAGGAPRVAAPAVGLDAWLRASSAEIETIAADSLVSGLAPVTVAYSAPEVVGGNGRRVGATTPEEAVEVLMSLAGEAAGGGDTNVAPYAERMLTLGEQAQEDHQSLMFVAAPSGQPLLSRAARAELEAAAAIARMIDLPLDVVVALDGTETEAAAMASQVISACEPRRLYMVAKEGISGYAAHGHLEWLQELWAMYRGRPRWLVASVWANDLFAQFLAAGVPGSAPTSCQAWYGADVVGQRGGQVEVLTHVYGGAANAVALLSGRDGLRVLTLRRGVRADDGHRSYVIPGSAETEVFMWTPQLDYEPESDPWARLLAKLGGGEAKLADAEFIIDVGYGVGGRDGVDSLAEPLRRVLVEELGLGKVMIGGTRKVTQDLELLPSDRQIGQTGVSVNPRLIIALAVSGAPQHVDYIGDRAVILSFNIDPDAPLMRLNDHRAKPAVYAIPGDVRQTIPRFIEALRDRLQRGVSA